MQIKTPRGAVLSSGTFTGRIQWTNSFGAIRSSDFKLAQKYIDSEAIRRMSPYTPFLTGVLEKSVTLGTVIGSGQLQYVAPHARYQYYGKLMVSSVTGSAWARLNETKILTDQNLKYSMAAHPKARSFWFEGMKNDHKKTILKGAAKIVGARYGK